jgi:hypothetical protein
MEKNPFWKANNHLVSQEIFSFLRDKKIHYRVYKSQALVLILSHMQSVHNFPPYLPTIHSTIIFPTKLRSSEWSHPSSFPKKLLNELCFWNLSIVRCLKNWGIKNIYQLSQYTRPKNSHKGQLLTTEALTWVHTHINPWNKSDTGGNKWPSHCTLRSY